MTKYFWSYFLVILRYFEWPIIYNFASWSVFGIYFVSEYSLAAFVD